MTMHVRDTQEMKSSIAKAIESKAVSYETWMKRPGTYTPSKPNMRVSSMMR